jgi:hypothetical protein
LAEKPPILGFDSRQIPSVDWTLRIQYWEKSDITISRSLFELLFGFLPTCVEAHMQRQPKLTKQEIEQRLQAA